MMLTPYKINGVWMFDDLSVGLSREPFVMGVGEILDKMTEHIPDAANGFNLFFSALAFPMYQGVLVWIGEEYGGNWYHWGKYSMEGWLCPALFKYFEQAPDELFFQAEAIKH